MQAIAASAGIDIGKAVPKATVRVQGDQGKRTRRVVRTLGTTTAQLLALRDWLAGKGVCHACQVPGSGLGRSRRVAPHCW